MMTVVIIVVVFVVLIVVVIIIFVIVIIVGIPLVRSAIVSLKSLLSFGETRFEIRFEM